MQSTLTAKPSDDPHDVQDALQDAAQDVVQDVVVVAPDAIRVAPSDAAPAADELSALLHQAARHRVETPARVAPDFAVGPVIPPVDTTYRSAAVNDALASGKRESMLRRTMRAFTALLLAVCIGVAAVAWRSSGIAAQQMIAQWTPQFILTWLPPDNSEPAAPPAVPAVVQADATDAAPPSPTPVQAAAEAAAPAAAVPSPESAQLKSMTRDLASLGQEVEQLKATIEQLKAGVPQAPREAAKPPELSKVSEPNLRPKLSALPPRPPAVRPRKPLPPLPQAGAAPVLPPTAAPYPAAAPYYPPRPSEPQMQATERLTDPELASVPRPPMPLR